jgi:nucleoside-diphosphate-sugar epimerase
MSVLIVGSNGFLGKYILREIKNKKHVETLGRKLGDHVVDISQSVPILHNRYEIVIHAAGKAHDNPKSKAEALEFFQVNVQGTINLLNAFELSTLPKSFVFISSVAVYGLYKGLNISEEAIVSAEDPYGKSKIQAELLVLDWCNKYKVKCTILRLPLIVGANPPGNLGAMIRGIDKGYYFNIGGGQAKKSMVLAQDVASFILKAAEVGGIYNLTDGYHPSFIELSSMISFQLGKRLPTNLPLTVAKIIAKIGNFIGSKSPLNSIKLLKITSDLTFDDSKARKAFGWNPTTVLEGFRIFDKNL